LARAGYKVTLIAPHTHNEIVQGVQIMAIPKAGRRLRRMTLTVAQLYRQAAQLKADLYHFHDPELIPAGLLLQQRGFKVIYDIHEDAPRALLSVGRAYLPGYLKRLVGWLLERLENVAARRFAALVTATPAITARFRAIQPQTYTINNFPILAELVPPRWCIWEERDCAVAYLGSIDLTRGLRQMVEAMAYLPQRLGARLRLAGRITAQDRLEVMSLPGWRYVDELGFLDRPGVAGLLGQIRAGLSLIHPEPRYMVAQPTKLYEYMSAGIPAIASDFPLWRELIEREQCGLVVNPLDVQGIAAAIEFVLTHPAEAEAMGQRGRQAIERQYNWPVEEGKLLELYGQLLSSVRVLAAEIQTEGKP
jgi:glycosyltransferase involved in cell wall biosynthesis